MCAYFVFIATFALIARCSGENLYCARDGTTEVKIDLELERQLSCNNLCTYHHGDKYRPSTVRNCHWRISFLNFHAPAHLCLELFVAHMGLMENRTHTAISSSSFVNILNTTQHGDCSRYYPWDDTKRLQLFSFFSESDFVDVSLQTSSSQEGQVADRFFMRISHSTQGYCSRGLVLQDGHCLAVRVTDQLAKAAAFPIATKAAEFLRSYHKLATSGGLEQHEVHLKDSPIRLGMSRCGCNKKQLVFWQKLENGSCVCANASFPADRVLEGSGDCLTVEISRNASSSESLKFKPTACGGLQATLLSFATTPSPSRSRACSASRDCHPARLQTECCFCRESDVTSSHTTVPVKIVFPISFIFVCIVAYVIHRYSRHELNAERVEVGDLLVGDR